MMWWKQSPCFLSLNSIKLIQNININRNKIKLIAFWWHTFCITCFLWLNFVCPFVSLYPGIYLKDIAWQSAKRLQVKSAHTETRPWWKSPAANHFWGSMFGVYCFMEELVSFPLGFLLLIICHSYLTDTSLKVPHISMGLILGWKLQNYKVI